LTEASIHNIPSIVLIVGTRSLIHRKIEVRKHLTRCHAPVRRTTFPQVLPPTAETWLLCSSHHHHGSFRLHHIFHLTKFGDHLTSHAPPRTSDISGEILHPDPRACSVRMTRICNPTHSETRDPICDPPKLPADVSPRKKKKEKKKKKGKAYVLFVFFSFVLFRYFLMDKNAQGVFSPQS
jgi:hypothetical protein